MSSWYAKYCICDNKPEFPPLLVLVHYLEIQLCTLHTEMHRPPAPNSGPGPVGAPADSHGHHTIFLIFQANTVTSHKLLAYDSSQFSIQSYSF